MVGVGVGVERHLALHLPWLLRHRRLLQRRDLRGEPLLSPLVRTELLTLLLFGPLLLIRPLVLRALLLIAAALLLHRRYLLTHLLLLVV